MADSLEQDSKASSSVAVGANERWSISIFDALKAPSLSDLTRKRRVHCNAPPKGKRRVCGEGSSEPKNVTVTQGVKEFSEACLELNRGREIQAILQSPSRGTKPQEELNCI